MPDQVRLQVKKDDDENTWADVGNKAGNEKLPVKVTEPVEVDEENASFEIENADMVEASTQTITKTVDGVSYTLTISRNAAGKTIGVSEWEEV